ncbi:centromere protein Q [Anguilla anguilla]|uniref:centromere protein Q n=1 Tax=Anguilla anguilla TaxID=7936 RepID=UPI0015ABA18D|nr:centromere protein Q [Anguilla anguilla]XP_035248868.1 centromere protein Q [Anguilla anguilla]
MKPSRGSKRASTRGPVAGSRKQGPKRSAQDGGPSKKKSETQKQPRKKRVGNDAARKVKGQEKWTLLPKISITALKNILDLSILPVLTMRRKDKDESQRHLNQLKDRFLASCAQLKVPPRPRKQGDMLQVSRLYLAERKKKAVGQRSLKALEDEVSAVVGALEEIEVKMDSLEQETRTLRGKLEDEEERAQEILQLSEQGVLNLPALPPQVTRELPLQERMLKDPEVAARLATALHSSAELRDMKAFLELAHGQADQLLLKTQGASPSAEDSSIGT